MSLLLFFTRGVSLKTWSDTGLLSREIALYRRLQEAGVSVTFVTYGTSDDLEYADQIPGISILCNRWNLPVRLYEKFITFLHAKHFKNADILKTNQTNGADIALRIARKYNKPLIARCGYMWSDFVMKEKGAGSSDAKKELGVEKEVFGAAQRVIVTTNEMRNNIEQRLALGDKITVIPNYVDTEVFAPDDTVTKQYDVIFIGRISKQKNVESLLEALSKLPVKAAIVGDGELRSTLQSKYAESSGLIEWLGRVPNSELPLLLNQSRLFILPSHYEGHPKTLLEAMGCGMPVIGADSPGIAEQIVHGQTGWLCETGSESIGRAISLILNDVGLRERLGRNARDFIAHHCSLDQICDMELKVYRHILEER